MKILYALLAMKTEQKKTRLMDTRLFALAALAAVFLVPVDAALAAKPGFGNLYYNDTIVRTVVPPASFPNEGRDNFYVITNGAEGQLGIAAVAPGDANYHGGQWKVFSVTSALSPGFSRSTSGLALR